jgi:predicted nucleic acid-binding protein
VTYEESIVPDTTVIASIFEQATGPEQINFRGFLGERQLVLSYSSVAELFELSYRDRWDSTKRERLLEFLKEFKVIAVDWETCLLWGMLISRFRPRGLRRRRCSIALRY